VGSSAANRSIRRPFSLTLRVPSAPSSQRTKRAGEQVGAFAGQVAGQLAATLDHDAQAAEGKDLDGHHVLVADPLDLLDRQHAGEDCPRDAEAFAVVAQRRMRRGGTLHGKMPRQVRMVPAGVIQHPHVRTDDRVGTVFRGTVNRGLPAGQPGRAGVGVQGDVDLAGPCMGIGDTRNQVGLGEVQAGEGARIGLVAKAEIHRVRAAVDRGLQRREISRRTHEIHARIPMQAPAHDSGRLLRRIPYPQW